MESDVKKISEKIDLVKYTMNDEIRTNIKRQFAKMQSDTFASTLSAKSPAEGTVGHDGVIEAPKATVGGGSMLPGMNFKDFLVIMNSKANREDVEAL